MTFDFISDWKRASPSDALELILKSSSQQHLNALDDLYRTILSQDLAKGHDFTFICSILGCIVVAKIPLSLRTICALLDIGYDKATWVTGRTAPVLRKDSGSTIRVIHQSFLDFLTDDRRSKEFSIDVNEYNTQLACQCLEVMNAKLHANMCKLTNMGILNAEIVDLASRLDQFVLDELRYSCQYWAEHISQSSNQDPRILPHLRKFCNEHALHWLEVMGLKGGGRNAVKAMRKIQKWLPVSNDIDSIVVHDDINASRIW